MGQRNTRNGIALHKRSLARPISGPAAHQIALILSCVGVPASTKGGISTRISNISYTLRLAETMRSFFVQLRSEFYGFHPTSCLLPYWLNLRSHFKPPPHLKCNRLVSVRSSHLSFKMYYVVFRAFKVTLY